MAKKTAAEIAEEEIVLSMPRPRLAKLIIKNFRCIGSEGVEIELDNIVVLVGPNNVGKSSILRAYALVMSDGSNDSKIDINDFPNKIVDKENLPQIELHTIVFEERVGKQWVKDLGNNEWLVREKWIWEDIGKPKRHGWDYTINDWNPDSFPFGPAAIANLRRPKPQPVWAFDNPDKQAQQIKDLLMAAINDRVKNLQNPGEEENEYHQLLVKVREIQMKIVSEAQEQIDQTNEKLSELISQVFPGYMIDFDAKPEDNLDKTINLFKTDSELKMGPSDGFKSTIDKQGSGARRTLLWTALKFISDSNQEMKDDGSSLKPQILLIDEPEICLHPNAIREASKVLYDLPKTGNWQVMATTHSPIFINFSQNNTTIVRVEKDKHGEVKGTTVFRPQEAKIGEDDIQNLKLLNLCDPYVAEFFFGGKVIIVEGDTEYTAFNYIKNLNPEKYSNIHIIRARGKATIVSLIKILNQFGSDYSILHDSDMPLTKANDRDNPAWGNNPNILKEVGNRTAGTKVRLLASLPNFESAYFSEETKTEKPYNALVKIREDEDKRETIERLLDALIDHEAPSPDNCAEWNSIEHLHDLLAAVVVLPEKIIKKDK